MAVESEVTDIEKWFFSFFSARYWASSETVLRVSVCKRFSDCLNFYQNISDVYQVL